MVLSESASGVVEVVMKVESHGQWIVDVPKVSLSLGLAGIWCSTMEFHMPVNSKSQYAS